MIDEVKVIPVGFCGAVYGEDKMVILGSAGAGKDTVKDEILNLIDEQKTPFTGRTKISINLADPIKQLCCIKFGLEMRDFEQDRKNVVLEHIGYSPRQLAQLEGTEYGRMAYGDNHWINTLKRRAALNAVEVGSNTILAFVGDIRFMNEADWVRENGVLVHVIRDSIGYDTNTDTNHASEKQILEYVEGDFSFINSSDKDLIKKNIIKSRLIERLGVRLQELINKRE